MSQPLLKQPSAFIPLAMSLASLALVVVHAVRYGIVHEADEGTSAHIFQLLMLAQIPLILYFAFKWIGREPRQAMLVLVLHVLGISAAFAAVYFLT